MSNTPASSRKRIVIAGTGASGAIYLQRLLNRLADGDHEVHLVLSDYANIVVKQELGELKVPEGVHVHNDRSMRVPFVSGSALFDAMVIIPCSMGTLGRIVHGTSESVILRAADVFLKERRKLILVPRETPWSLVHARNVVSAIECGATVIPAMPSFYNNPTTIEEVADSVVFRVLDHLGIFSSDAPRWEEE
jgi:4-hydroxy-3-polyprenylbenzoate decarboxylase